MVRPKNCRMVGAMPERTYFKPRGIPLNLLQEIILNIDEFEALRLADLENFYQEQAAEKMGVSRQTFGRIIKSARKKVTAALVQGKALRIEGGTYETAPPQKFVCEHCRYTWELPCGAAKTGICPSCRAITTHSDQKEKDD